jgi:transcriptional regulator with XRE-family HTH domain
MASEHAPEELEKLITELTAWCEAKYGRQTELADRLGVSKQLVANWFADTEHRP